MPDPADFRKFCSSLLFSKKLNNTIVLQHKQHMRAVVLALVALLAVVAANEFDSPWVINLTDENFDQLVTNQSSWMLEFYAPWCSHCKKLAPAYAAAAKASVDKLSFGKVDCTANSQLVKRFGIKGYPVLKFWRDGHYRSYRHERTEADMISFANSVTANPLKVAETAEQFDELIKDQPVSMLVLVPPANTRTKMVQLAEEQYMPMARRFQGMLPWFISSDPVLYTRYKQDKPESVVVLAIKEDPKNEIPHYTMFPGVGIDKFESWVEQHRRALVSELDHLNFEDMTTTGRRTLIAVVELDGVNTQLNAQSKALIQHLQVLSKQWGQLYLFGYLGANKWKTYLDKFGIHQPTHLPTVFLLDGPAEMYWQPAHLKDAASGPMSSFDDIQTFISQVSEGKIVARGNTPFSFGGIMKRIADFLESFSDMELIFGAVVFMVVFLGFMIYMAVSTDNTKKPMSKQERDRIRTLVERKAAADAEVKRAEESKKSE